MNQLCWTGSPGAGAEPVARVHRTDLDRAGAQEEAAQLLRDGFLDLGAQLAFGAQRLGAGHVGHRLLVVQPVGGELEAGRHVEDRLALLHRDHAARGEAAPLEIADDAVDDRMALVARAHEIGVERMRGLVALDRALRGLERLADHLPAEHAATPPGWRGPR